MVTFNESGEITQLETTRYMDPAHLETWVIKATRYKELNEVKIPTQFDVLWRLAAGDFSYANFSIQKIEYNIPKRFKS